MKQQFVVIHWYTVLQETKKARPNLDRPTLQLLCFYINIRTSNFWGSQHFHRRFFCNTAPSYCGILTLMNCVSYNKLPFH